MTATHMEHKAQGPQSVRCAVITVSDSRTLETDTGGKAVIDHLTAAGHSVVQREIIPDDPARMRPLLEALGERDDVDAILMTGGTGGLGGAVTTAFLEAGGLVVLPTRRDTTDTPEALRARLIELSVEDRCRRLLESYKEEAIRSLAVLDEPTLKGLLRRIVGKIFNDIELKGWCREFEARNAAGRAAGADAAAVVG